MTTISTRLGKVMGRSAPAMPGTERGVLQCLGIPYAKPPLGELRFRAPQPHGPWSGTLNATQLGNRAMQTELPDVLKLGRDPAPDAMSEDCLVLNIYTPAADGRARPVLFWIHGGGFTIGSANDYDGSVLAAQGDVVVVAVNYRMGLFGYLDLAAYGDELAGSASNGFRDQILALAWVRDNIADYGGDPDNVTIFGESAGGASVNAILAAPSADGLYHRAIAHSGTATTTPPPPVAAALAGFLKVPEEGLLQHLQAMPAADLLAAQADSGIGGGASIDGTVVTRDTYQAIAEHGAGGVPYIAGYNANEGTLFTAVGSDPDTFAPMAHFIAQMTCDGADPTDYLVAMRDAHPDDGAQELYERAWTDMFRRASMRTCEAATDAGPGGWLYRFDLPSTVMDGRLGATHASEIAFTFNAYTRPDAPGLKFHDGNDPAVRRLAEQWSNTVIAFARNGNPNGAGLPQWSRYSATERTALVLDAEPRIEADPDAAARGLWPADSG